MTPEELCDKYRNVRSKIPALAKLYDVDWSSVHHAHGEASDFPILINAALSTDEMDRDFALRLLHETIWHQGTIYQATAFAVPFIVDLIRSPDINNQADFANLLSSIAQGQGAFEDGFRSKEEEQKWREIFGAQGIDLEDFVAESKKWGQAARDEVRKNLRVLYPFLNYPDGFNSYIASTLACYPELSDETIPLIEKAMELEKDENVRKWLNESLQKLKAGSDFQASSLA